MLDWAYFKAVVCIWFLAVIPASAYATLLLIAPQVSKYIWASLIIAVLFTVIASYVTIALNLKRRVPSYSSGAVSSERKLTVTLLVVIVLSTLALLPNFFYAILETSTSIEDRFIKQLFLFLFYANSFVNPLVYTLRMKEFRKATRVWCGSVNTVSRSQIIEMNMWLLKCILRLIALENFSVRNQRPRFMRQSHVIWAQATTACKIIWKIDNFRFISIAGTRNSLSFHLHRGS